MPSFCKPPVLALSTHDAADNALEALYLASLSETFPSLDTINGNDIAFNVYAEGYSEAASVVTISGFQFRNGNGATAEIRFGE